jgi:hypothetical protein
MSVQSQLFRQLRQRIPAHLSAENEISKLLNLTLEQAFQVMRGVVPLTLDQADTLSRTYSISLDALRPSAPTFMSFRFHAVNYDKASLEEYFDTVMDEIKNIDLYGTRQLHYAASDLPIFTLFQFPELSAFKLFYWGKHVYHLPAFAEAKLSLKHFPQEVLLGAERTWKQYLKIPSVEVWSSEVVNNILREIMALWHYGDFASKNDALKVCNQVADLLDQVEEQARIGTKFHPYLPVPNKANYTLYYTEVGINNNNLLVRSETGTTAYVTQNELNFLQTDNEAFLLQQQRWFHGLISGAELISQANTELRTTFFNRLRENIDWVREEIGNSK